MAIRNAEIPLDLLEPTEENYNNHGQDAIDRMVARIKAVGFTAPVLVGEARSEAGKGGKGPQGGPHPVAGGHLRRLALLQMRAANDAEPEGVGKGWLVPCRVGSWSDVQRLKVLIGDNPDPHRIDYDARALSDLLARLDAEGDLAGTGYDEGDLDTLILELGLEGDGEEGDGGKPDGRGGGVKRGGKVSAVLIVSQLDVFERAIRAAGDRNRGDALVRICQAYLDGYAGGEADGEEEGQLDRAA